MIYTPKYFIDLAKQANHKKLTLVVTCPYEEYTLSALSECVENSLVEVILVGKLANFKSMLSKYPHLKNVRIEDATDDEQAAIKTMQLLANNEAQILMKGLIDTSVILKALLNKEFNLKTGKAISHITLTYSPTHSKYYLVSDAAMNIKPSLEIKKGIVQNCVDFAHVLGIAHPNVAILCAKEKLYDKMPDTIDAVALQTMNKNGEITGCLVSGPLQLDTAVDPSSVSLKDNHDPVAGKADILICPNIEAANIFTKGLVYLSDWRFCGLLVGTKIPMVLTSRASRQEERIVSIALACIAYSSNK